MSLALILLSLSAALYFAAFMSHIFSFIGSKTETHPFAFAFMRIGFLISTIYFFEEAVDKQYFLPVYQAAQALAFFAWSVAFVYLVLLVRIQRESFGLVLTPILFLFSAAACFTLGIEAKPLTGLSNAYFTLHVMTAFFAYACFTISFAASILYLIQQHELKSKRAGKFYHRLPALDALEKLIFQPMVWGAMLLLAAVGIGFIWSKSAYDTFFFVDVKTVLTLITFLIYGVILYLHYVSAFRGKRVIVASLLAFGLVMFSFVGMRFIENSHGFMR